MSESYQKTKQELFEIYGSARGHTGERANQLLLKYGKNEIEGKGKKGICRVFLGQFADLLVILLILSAVISMLSDNVESMLVILAVILINAVLGTVQYIKAEKSLDSLKKLSAPRARVFRDGARKEIAAVEIVPGDVLCLEAGDLVAADGRILESYSLLVNESALTGESANVEKRDETITKEVGLGDRYNMVFSGSLVTYGRATVLVTGTGMNTEMGKIAALMNEIKDQKTPLQVNLDEFGRKLAMIILMISVVVFGLRLWQKEPLLDSLMFAVALAVAAIPEALGSIVTIVQAIGTRRMASDHAIIKDLKAVECLGCVSVICSDKTGTLTQNKMTVKEIYLDRKCIQPEELDLRSALHRYFLYIAILNNDSSINGDKNIGDPTEICLLNMARRAGLTRVGITENDIRSMMPRLEEIPFDSDRKLMSTKYRVHGIETLFTKGAVDILLERADRLATSAGIRKMHKEDKEEILRQNQLFSKIGLRVLAFAYRECGGEAKLSADKEYGYIFVGLVSMMDPPREESIEAVADAIRAGIKPVMITGDHKVTASAIAKQIGIYRDGDLAVTGQELDQMSDDELDRVLGSISVFARVSPENKIRIVDAWQRQGHIVAMTGDGVNDAPALKRADIGVAMGMTGTEVAKDASAMIIADDHFATIIHAIRNGRNVYKNIMNSIRFLLSGNMAAILVVLFCSFMALDTPFEPVHLLFINLLTDSLPALAIGMESCDQQLLKEKPRNPREGILTMSFLQRLTIYGFLIATVTQIAYFCGLQKDPATASTMAFATLTLARLFHGFTCRSDYSIFRIGVKGNLWSIAAFMTGVLFLTLILFVPSLHGLFRVEALELKQIGRIGLLALLPTAVIQIVRLLKEQISKRSVTF